MQSKNYIRGVALWALALLAAAQEPPETMLYRNTALSPEERAVDLVFRMTLEEKAQQLGHAAPAIPRLGVPQYNWWNEGLHGVARAGVATVFPQAIAMAASWDTPLLQKAADVISTEFRAKYVERMRPDGGSDWYRGLTVWSPNINIFRDPRWGRGQETYGEDPYLTSRMGVAFIHGLQGDHPRHLKTVATSKHFAVHSGPESNRHKEDVHPTPHDLHDTYLPAFRASVIEGKAHSVMCAYNAVNGIPSCASEELMEKYLRGSWGFTGYVVSDCGGAANIFRKDSLHYKPNAEEGVAAGINAGMDLICGDYRNNMSTEPEGIVGAVKKGLLSERVLDRALRRLFVARIRLGMFDPPSDVVYSKITPADNDTPAHRAVSLDMARASLVLLKNARGFLPLKKAPKTIAVIGPNADSLDALLGNYNGTPSAPVTILAGLRARFPEAAITHVEGTGLIGPVTAPVPWTAYCTDRTCNTPGLVLETFDNPRLEGDARTERANLVEISAAESAPGSSRRWSGMVRGPESGEYRFGYASTGGYRVWVNDQLVIEDWTARDAPSLSTGKITLEANRLYPLRVESNRRGAPVDQKLVWSLPSQRGDDAVKAARHADLVIFVAGLSARIEGEEMKVDAPGFAGGDRTSIDLPAPQQQLLERVYAANRRVVLVLMNGSALAVNWADEKIPAIVEAWYPGGEGGTAVASLLAGDFSPAGRLPVTFYKSADQLPAFSDYSMTGRTYRYFDGEPLYPFGHGLSYTTFRYANARVDQPVIGANGEVKVSVDVTNAGDVAGDEVVQLYVSHAGVPGAPLRSLAGFERIHLRQGESKTVAFLLSDRALSVVDQAGKRVIVPGAVDVWVGGGQPVARTGLAAAPGTKTRFTISDAAVLPE